MGVVVLRGHERPGEGRRDLHQVMELQSSLLSPSGEDSTPCHMVGEMDGHHDDHALGCDSLCAQCTGFIPGIFAAPPERMSSTTRFPLTGTDPVPQYGPPLYKPPRA